MKRTTVWIGAWALVLGSVAQAEAGQGRTYVNGTRAAMQANAANSGTRRVIESHLGHSPRTYRNHRHSGHIHTRGSRYYYPYYYPRYYTYSTPYYYPYSPYYGPGTSYDPAAQGLRDENARLRREMNQLQQDKQAAQKPAVKINLPLRGGKRDAAARKEDRSAQLMLAGSRLFRSGSYRRSVDRFANAVVLDPKNPTARIYLAQALFAARQYAKAADEIKEALKRNPDWLELDFDMKALYGNEDDFLPQLAILAEELKEQPLDRNALFVLGFELFVSGQKEKARTILEQSARLEPDDTHLKPFFDYYEKLDPPKAAEPASVGEEETPTPRAKPEAPKP